MSWEEVQIAPFEGRNPERIHPSALRIEITNKKPPRWAAERMQMTVDKQPPAAGSAPLEISDELMERARMLVGISENLGLPLSGEGGPELNEAVRRAQAERFLSSLDIEALKVGDGSDGLPVWIGIDADARKVYKIYASGLAQGFGDGNLTIINGLQSAEWRVGNGEQLTFGRHVALSGDNVPPTIFESDPHPVAKTPLPNWEAVAKIVKTKPLFILHMPDGQEIRLLASGPEGISGTGIKFESRIWELLRLLPREAYV